MVAKRGLAKAVEAIDKHGILLVYPIANRSEPKSLWSALHPRATMRWAWDESGDDRVVALWHLREELARSRQVVYGKWFRRRATFFARPVFRAMLREIHALGPPERTLSPDARRLLDALEESSPQGTRALRAAADLTGRLLESTYLRAADELWVRLLIVGAGEADEGGFPSLSMGATKWLFEDLWDEARDPSFAGREEDAQRLARALEASAPFAKMWNQSLAKRRALSGSTSER